ncbi:MAG: DMT family transporter [Veillonellaceae bacterium]|nr:DMT family transporter [Veillonellaceae bacterium]
MNQTRKNHWLGVLYVNFATLAWASNMVVGRMLKDLIGPVTLAASRFIVASVIFVLLLRHQPAPERKIGADWRLLLGMALTGVVLFSPSLYLGLRYTSAVNGTLINGIGPLLTGAMAAVFLGQPMSQRQVSGALVGLVGVVFLITNGTADFWQTARFNAGDLIVLLSVAIWGLYSVMGSRVMRSRSAISTTALSTLLGLPILLLLSFWEMFKFPVVFDVKLLLGVVYLGVVPAAGGFCAWNAGVSRLGPGGAMVFYNTLPLYGALLGVTLLGEPLGLSHAVGAFMIIGGSLWAAKK